MTREYKPTFALKDQSLVNPSALRSSLPTPLWTMNKPAGSTCFFLPQGERNCFPSMNAASRVRRNYSPRHTLRHAARWPEAQPCIDRCFAQPCGRRRPVHARRCPDRGSSCPRTVLLPPSMHGGIRPFGGFSKRSATRLEGPRLVPELNKKLRSCKTCSHYT